MARKLVLGGLLCFNSCLVNGIVVQPTPIQPFAEVYGNVSTSQLSTTSVSSLATVTASSNLSFTAAPTSRECSFWLEDIAYQGISAFNPDTSYKVFRNVKDFGAKGDGKTDDTNAINQAISTGDRCAPGVCGSSTLTPALVSPPSIRESATLTN
jgi:hypothetical protein